MVEEAASKPKLASLLSISHDKDVDGLSAAAIVWRYAKAKGMDHDVILADYGSFDKAFTAVANRRNTLIVVTDLGMDESSLDVVIAGLESAISQGSRIVWLDHHRWSDRSIKSVLALGNKPVLRINHNFCAAEIAWKVLMPRDEKSAELARIAHDTDFNLREIPAASALTDALSVKRFAAIEKREDITDSLLPLLTRLAEDGVEGVWDAERQRFKNDLLERRVKNYRKEKLKKMRKALKGHCDQQVHGRVVRIIEIPNGVTTTDLGTFLSDEKNLQINGEKLEVADLLVSVSQGGMLGFRRGRETVLCDAAAKIFNGGGHPYAAGGEYGVYDDFQAVCDDIIVTLEKDKTWVD